MVTRLHIGSGQSDNPDIYDWTRLDIDPNARDVSIVHDIRKPLPLPDTSVEEIYASHVLEHIPYRKVIEVLTDWHRVLTPGGKLSVFVPDIWQLARNFRDNPTGSNYLVLHFRTFAAVGQTSEIEAANSHHLISFDCRWFRYYLPRLGFSDIEFVDRGYNNIEVGVVAYRQRSG